MSNGTRFDNSLFGLSAEFASPEELLEAAKLTRDAGYTDIKAYSPFPVHGIDEVLGNKTDWLGPLTLVAILAGIAGAFVLMYWTSVVHYPINVGGRPVFPWPAFFPILFETAVLFGGFTAVGYLLITTGLPLPYHPVFNTPGIEEASRSRFFLCIQTTDEKFHLKETRKFLDSLEPINVSEVAS